MLGIRRRDLITLLGGTAAVWPLAARGQQPPTPVVGVLSLRSPWESQYLVTAFRNGLNETGYAESRNVAIEYQWAEGKSDRLPTLAADLVHRQVSVLVASGGTTAALAAKAATTTIPIVFTAAIDPVKYGLVASFNRPSGNITGVVPFLPGMETKRLQLMHELAPKSLAIAVLVNPEGQGTDSRLSDIYAAANVVGRQITVLKASTEAGLDDVFASLRESRVGAILVDNSPYFDSRRDQIVALAARYMVPAIYDNREFATTGGLISYGASIQDSYRVAGTYVGRILRGERPADLPISTPTRFELVINLKTARALGLSVPLTLYALANEVIE
jgi:putative ABC transport system substrate-binding protein